MVQIVLHHLINSRSERIFWALEELGLPYDVKVYQREPTHRAPASYKGTGKAPMIELDGEVISESGNIMERLVQVARESGKASAETTPSHDSTYFAHFAEGTLMLWMQASTLITITTGPMAFARASGASEDEQKVVERYAEWVQANFLKKSSQSHIDQLEQFISKHEWFSGSWQPGIGDFMLSYPLIDVVSPGGTAPWRKNSYEVGEGLKAWHARLQERPAYKRGVQRREQEEAAEKKSSL